MLSDNAPGVPRSPETGGVLTVGPIRPRTDLGTDLALFDNVRFLNTKDYVHAARVRVVRA